MDPVKDLEQRRELVKRRLLARFVNEDEAKQIARRKTKIHTQ